MIGEIWQSCQEPLYNDTLEDVTIPSETILMVLYSDALEDDGEVYNGYICLLSNGTSLFVNDKFFLPKNVGPLEDVMTRFEKL